MPRNDPHSVMDLWPCCPARLLDEEVLLLGDGEAEARGRLIYYDEMEAESHVEEARLEYLNALAQVDAAAVRVAAAEEACAAARREYLNALALVDMPRSINSISALHAELRARVATRREHPRGNANALHAFHRLEELACHRHEHMVEELMFRLRPPRNRRAKRVAHKVRAQECRARRGR